MAFIYLLKYLLSPQLLLLLTFDILILLVLAYFFNGFLVYFTIL